MANTTGIISPVKIEGIISTANSVISGDITYGIGSGDFVPEYEGEYSVVPLAFEETRLSTKNKKLTEDIVVKEIPYYETSNTSGGTTVYIAGQIEFY